MSHRGQEVSSVQRLPRPDTAPLVTWTSEVNQWCGPMEIRGDRRTFTHGALSIEEYGRVRVSVIRADAHTALHRPTPAAQSDNLYVFMPLEGEFTLRELSRDARVGPDELIMVDTARSYRMRVEAPITFMAVRVPHLLVGLSPASTQSLTGTVWSNSAGVPAMVSTALRAISDHMHAPKGVAAESMGLTVAGLLTSLFAERLQAVRDDSNSARQLQFMSIQAYLRDNLTDPALAPGAVAKHFRVSLRYLQMLFSEHDNSPARWIRAERLERCKSDLLNPAFANLTVAAIGERWGFYGASHFTRMFREHFGVPPSALRGIDGTSRDALEKATALRSAG
ncbi:MAG TPA: helix-turn-helix domain-containing protein [Jatrophihabitans sp.]|jgi:AraC-like DNA-binding protein|uniref:helix-turn-helix domain-containing protein n=1 Tax=Jatrophihabitans sp. TaxID=1932789 RepID=UPI002EE76972